MLYIYLKVLCLFMAGNGCRIKVTKLLVTRFKTVADAEEAYEITHIGVNDLTQSLACGF